jgi:hypothetical protein
LVAKSEGKEVLERPKHRERIELKWLFQTRNGNLWIGLIWLRIGRDQ